jgi:hypothetical protein
MQRSAATYPLCLLETVPRTHTLLLVTAGKTEPKN